MGNIEFLMRDPTHVNKGDIPTGIVGKLVEQPVPKSNAVDSKHSPNTPIIYQDDSFGRNKSNPNNTRKLGGTADYSLRMRCHLASTVVKKLKRETVLY